MKDKKLYGGYWKNWPDGIFKGTAAYYKYLFYHHGEIFRFCYGGSTCCYDRSTDPGWDYVYGPVQHVADINGKPIGDPL